MRLGPYEILAPIGAGGMGEVYKARDTRLGRDVAIKVLPAEVAADPDRLRRFEQEARATAALSHPNILAIHDLGTHEDSPYLVEELLEGQSLRQRLSAGAIPARKAVEIAAQVASGLAAAHARGIFHRDLKPENLFLTTDGIVKILDFGLAKLAVRPPGGETPTEATTESQHTAGGVVLGTVPYMAPEQARGMPVDQRADVFAFGVVLYEMLGGRRPFRGATSTDTVAVILKDEPPPLPASVPAPLAAVVSRCLAKEPGERYQGGGELKAAFDALPDATGTDRHGAGREAARPRRASRRKRIRSVVVLPLLDFSRDPEQEYFADGMTEALIADLAKIRALRVISRTSAMRYKATRKSLPEIAAELGVDGVVEGSVMRAGQRVRITAQLIHAATDTHLWAESYERDFQDVLLPPRPVGRLLPKGSARGGAGRGQEVLHRAGRRRGGGRAAAGRVGVRVRGSHEALELEKRAAAAHVPAVRIARLWARAGDADRALGWLEKAHAWRESPLVHLKVGWDWDGLRGDPRFQSLLDRMKFPEGAARRGPARGE